MANKRDVSLVIRARNEATKAVDSVTSALREINKAAKDFKSGAGGTDSLLSALGTELGKLNQQAGGGNAFDKLAQGSQRAEQAVSRLQNELRETSNENARLKQEAQQAAAETRRLAAETEKAAAEFDRQKAATREARAEQTRLNQEVRKAEQAQTSKANADAKGAARLELLGEKVLAAQQRYDRLGQEMESAVSPSKRLQQQYEAAGRALEKQLNTLVKAQSAHAENRNELAQTGQQLSRLKQDLAGASQAYEAQRATQERAKNTLAETRAQARGAQQQLTALEQAVESNERAFNQKGQALQRANEEMREVRQVAGEANVAIAKMGTTIRTQLLRTLQEGQQRLRDFKNASDFGTATLAGMAGRGVDRQSPEFQNVQAQARLAKEAYREQQVAVERMRREIRAAGTDVNLLSAAQQKFQSIQASTNARIRQAEAAMEQYAGAARGAAQANNRAAATGGAFSNSLALLRRNTRQSLSLMQRFRGEVLAMTTQFAGLYAAMAGTRGVAKAYMTLEAAQNRLGAVFNQNTQRVGQEIDWLMSQADRLGIQFGVLSDQYAKFAVAANVANYQSAATREIFLSVAEAGRVNKLSMEQLQGIFMALEQMISKGKITSEELRRQLGDRLPGAFQIMADALGMTTMELDNAMKAGEVFSNQDNLLRFADQLRKRFGEQLPDSLNSFTAEWGRFQNEIFKAELRAGQAGFIEGMRVALKDLTVFFRSAEGQTFFNNLGAAAGALAKGLAAVVRNLDAVLAVMGAIIGRKLGAYVTALVADFKGLSTTSKAAAIEQRALNATQRAGVVQGNLLTRTWVSLRAAAVALGTSVRASAAGMVAFGRGMTVARGAALAAVGVMRTLRAVLATLGGPIGLLVTGLSILFTTWVTSASEATEVTSELARQVQILREAYSLAGEDAEKFRKQLEKLTKTQIEANLGKIRERLADGLGRLAADIGKATGQALYSSTAGFTVDDLAPLRGAVEDLQDQFAKGLNPDIDTFRKKVDQIAQANPALKSVATALLDTLDLSDDNEQSVAQLSEQYQRQADLLTVKLKPGTDEAREALERLGVVQGEVLNDTADGVDKFAEAIAKLNKELPQMKTELERLEKVEKLKGILDSLGDPSTFNAEELERYYDLVRKIVAAIEQVNTKAANSYVTGSLVDRIVDVESGGKADARNPNSTATGLGQFIESTWVKMFKRYFPDRARGMSKEAILMLREEADLSRQMVELYAKENAQVLQRAGVAVNDAALYLAHFLGPGGALKVLQASPDTPVTELVGQAQIAANPTILGGGQTAGGLQAWAQDKVGVSDQQIAVNEKLNELAADRLEKQREFRKSLAQESADREFQLQQLEKEANGKARQAAIDEAVRDAKLEAQEAGVQLSEKELATIKEQTGALWDQQNAARLAAEERQRIEERVNTLMQHRRDLMEGIEFAEDQGEGATADQLRQQYEDITAQLYTAIEASRQYWLTQTGPEAQAALTNLDNMERKLGDIGQKASLSGKQINQMFSSGAADALLGFADALAAGENALNSLGNAFRQFAADFLRQIARMIIQQAIFNAISGAAGGGGIGGAIAGFFNVGTNHTGGIAGSGPSRSVSAGLFANAARYHSGGIAGIKPGEVPAILERGEEVLTRDDPRHVANGGGAAGGQMPEFKIINAIDAGDFVSQGMNTTPGQKAVMNFIRANSRQIKGMLG